MDFKRHMGRLRIGVTLKAVTTSFFCCFMGHIRSPTPEHQNWTSGGGAHFGEDLLARMLARSSREETYPSSGVHSHMR